MTQERWRQLRELFDEAADLPAAERQAYLDTKHPQRDSLRAEVERMLAEHDGSDGDFLERPIASVRDLAAPVAPLIAVGEVIDHYRIEELLGEGGMGCVYKARDLHLDRWAALKFISPRLVASEDERKRFEREAQALARVSHPNLCALHGVGRHGDVPYIALEFLDGETLQQRLDRGPLPLEAALRWATHVADALSTAHQHGVVHRDVKPGNIMLTATGAKLVDFGLARMLPVGAAALSSHRTLTREGQILGTIRYMSPEQLQNECADERSDVFAFGAVLHEMLTGKRAFDGRSSASVIATILEKPVQRPSSVQPKVPSVMDEVVGKCLAKKPADRWQTMAEVSRELHWLAAGSSRDHVAARPGREVASGSRVWQVAAAVLALLLAWTAMRSPQTMVEPVRLALPPPPGMSFGGRSGIAELAVSPDGRTIAFAASDASGASRLWVRRLDSLTATPLTGTERGHYPFWSPDGKEIGFFASGAVRRTPATGGSPRVVCDATDGRGGAWSANGTILFSPSPNAGLMRVAATGGQPRPVTTLNTSRAETSHRWPQFLPDGTQFVFQVTARTGGQPGVYAGSLKGGAPQRLVTDASAPVYAEPGYLLTYLAGGLVARRMDAGRLRIDGEPERIAERIAGSPSSGRASFAAGGSTLVFGGHAPGGTGLVWRDRTGREAGTVRGYSSGARLTSMTADGRKLALMQWSGVTHRAVGWLLDTDRGTQAPVAMEATDHSPLLSPDGTRIAYGCVLEGGREGVCVSRLAGGREQVAVPGRNIVTPLDWSRDGRRLLFEARAGDAVELSWLDLERMAVHALLQTGGEETRAQLSPDGRWVAYKVQSERTIQLNLQAFPGPGPRWAVSGDGGSRPRWRGDSRELYFLQSGDTPRLMAMSVGGGQGVLEWGPPQVLFKAPPGLLDYFVTADGKRFLLSTATEESPEPLTVMVHWAERR